MSDVVVLGVNHKTAPIEIRERFDFSRFPIDQYLPKLGEGETIRTGFVLSTCNRVEIYTGGTGELALIKETKEYLQSFHRVEASEWDKWFYLKTNREAIKHLFRVAASLDSLMVGEPQIIGQVKEAYSHAASFSLIDPFFDRLLRKTLGVAKKIRTETKISEQAVSISYAAVELAKKIFGQLKEKTVLVLGAGEMAELVAKHLHRQQPRRMMFSNRTYESSVEFARRFEGIPVTFEKFPEYLSEADIVIVSTGAPHYLLDTQHIGQALAARKGSPMFLIDISVPRNVDPQVNRFGGVFLYNVDDLAEVVQSNRQGRVAEAERAETIVEVEVNRFFQAVEKMKVAPVIQILQRKYDEMARQELLRLERKTDLAPEMRVEIVHTAQNLVRRILNDPILFLKEENSKQTLLEKADMVCRVFGLDKPQKDEN